MRQVIGVMFVLAICSSPLAAGEWWEKIPYTQWSEGQANTMLYSSPWAKWSGFYEVRLLTARPIREAMLRRGTIDPGPVINVREIRDADGVQQSRLSELISSNPDSFLVKGDEERIIISVRPMGLRHSRPEFSKMVSNAVLETNTGKRIKPVAFAAPGRKAGEELQLFFERKLPDGTFFIGAGDKELRFISRLSDRTIKAKFPLKKMMYRGKLEY